MSAAARPSRRGRCVPRRAQRGAAMIELALSALVLLSLLLGAVEVARLLWTWHSAAEATRLGARLAAVCDKDDAVIKTRMRQRLPELQDSHITLAYLNPGSAGNCNASNCRLVRVTLSGYSHELLLVPATLSVPIPDFATTVPREVMASTGHPVCAP